LEGSGALAKIQQGVDDANKVVELLRKALDIVMSAPI